MDLRNYDDKGSANHYKDGRIDLQHQLEAIWGTFQLMTFCEMSAFCYRMRAGKKIGNEIEQEIKKAEWFEKRAKFLKMKLECNKGIAGTGTLMPIDSLDIKLEEEFLRMLQPKKEEDIHESDLMKEAFLRR